MRIVWLCNIELPQISAYLGKEKSVFGGWLSQVADQITLDNELYVLYPSLVPQNGKLGNLYFQTFNKKNSQLIMDDLISSIKPDVIHIWGTEYKHSNDLVLVLEKKGLIDKCVISIQGLVSICGDYHYSQGLPNKIVKGFTLRDLIKRDNIFLAENKFKIRGVYEKDTLRRVKHVIGRTEWDKACTFQLNPQRKYHFCNETLRSSFYNKKWNISNIEKHSIFVSQCSYPIKGFHELLKVMPLILEKFPNTKVYTTGKDLLNLTFRQKLMLTSYQKYLIKLIKENNLQDGINFLGFLDEEKMAEQYLKSNVFLSASTIENSSNSVGEAMLLGCPTVASYVGGTMNMLRHGEEGFLYQFSAPYMMAYYICRIFEDDELALSFSEKSIKHAKETHNKDKNFHRLLEIYNSICDA